MELVINIAVILLIALTYWFFFRKNESNAVSVSEEVKILVAGGYAPDVLKIKAGKPVTLNFERKDESSCLEEVVIPELGIRQHLTLNEVTSVVVNPEKPGIYPFSCGMGMFHGKIIVEE